MDIKASRQPAVSDDIIQELQNAVGAKGAEPVSAPSVTPSPHPLDTWARTSRQRIMENPGPAGSARSLISLAPWLLGAAAVVGGLLYVSREGLQVKARVMQEGSAAISNLVAAKDDLEHMDFHAAHGEFAQAHDRFDAAHDELGLMGTFVGKLLAVLPGAGKLRTAQDLIEAGTLISHAGSSLAEAVSTLSGGANLLDPANNSGRTLGQLLEPMQKALADADRSMTRAAELLSSIDPSSLPDDAREQFGGFLEKLPEVRGLIEQGDEGVTFLSRLVGTDRPRRYLILFQNSSELRPTGGFPGSFGLVTFENGKMRDVTTGDIYGPDGQIRQLVVPPLQLQHITPSWGMRDANWFIDFPTSARKVMEFYQRGGGASVDGVIALRPQIMADLLRITGPISMPGYDVVLTAENFLPTIQLEVESKKTDQPKQVIMDLTPLMLAKLSTLPTQQWARVLDVFKSGMARRDVLLSLQDSQLQEYVARQDWDGHVKDMPGDYLMVTASNIKGAKADAVTDTALKVESWMQDGAMAHRLTITRSHNGGHSDYGFYNKTNYSYVRVLVPKGSTLRGIAGNDRPANKPMMDYSGQTVVRDPDLERLESTYQYDAVRSVTTYEESGKTGFGFWMKIEPGATEETQLEYVVPAGAVSSDYRFYVQRQPGLDVKDLEFTFQKNGPLKPVSSSIPLTEWPDSWRLHDPFQHDLDLSLKLQ